MKRGRMRAKLALFPVNGILPATRPASVRFADSFPPMGEAFFRYKYPPLRRTKIQPVSVRAERRVVRAMQLEVSTPSWPMFLLMT